MKWARRILFVALLVALPIGAYQFVSRNEQPPVAVIWPS